MSPQRPQMISEKSSPIRIRDSGSSSSSDSSYVRRRTPLAISDVGSENPFTSPTRHHHRRRSKDHLPPRFRRSPRRSVPDQTPPKSSLSSASIASLQSPTPHPHGTTSNSPSAVHFSSSSVRPAAFTPLSSPRVRVLSESPEDLSTPSMGHSLRSCTIAPASARRGHGWVDPALLAWDATPRDGSPRVIVLPYGAHAASGAGPPSSDRLSPQVSYRPAGTRDDATGVSVPMGSNSTRRDDAVCASLIFGNQYGGTLFCLDAATLSTFSLSVFACLPLFGHLRLRRRVHARRWIVTSGAQLQWLLRHCACLGNGTSLWRWQCGYSASGASIRFAI